MSLSLLRLRRGYMALFRGTALDREHDEEVAFHIEAETAELERVHGLSHEEARRRAFIAFGGRTQMREAHRDIRGISAVESVASDVHYSARSLTRAKIFACSAILILALGIGASTGIFSAVDAVLLARLPYPSADRLVRVALKDGTAPPRRISTADAQAIRTGARSFEAFGVAREQEVALLVGKEPEQGSVAFADGGFFRALGVRPDEGRVLQDGDGQPGAAPVALLAHEMAVRAFGTPRQAVGQSILVDGQSYTVVGVLARGIDDLAGARGAVWAALRDSTPTRRGPFNLLPVARLAPGVTAAGANRELASLSHRVFPIWASSFQDSSASYVTVPLRTAILGRAPDTLRALALAVALVLLIVIANVTNLTLVRAIGRAREFALRETLGATRARLARLRVIESVMISLAGAVLGVFCGAAALRALVWIAPGIPRLSSARIDSHAAAFTAVLAVVCGALIGIVPVFLLRRDDIGKPMGGESRTASEGRAPLALRGAFVAGQFALALPLLAAAGLLLNSFVRLQEVRPGFDPSSVLTVRLTLPAARYPSDTAIQRFWIHALAEIRTVPGVEMAGLNTALPPNDANVCCNNFDLVDHPVPKGTQQPFSPWMVMSPEYFTTLGIRLEEGRSFTANDTGAPPVIAVSRSWAQHYFPEGQVLGRRLIGGGCITCPLTTVVAVVGDVKYEGLDGSSDAVYTPASEAWGFTRSAVLFVRSTGNPRDLLPSVRAALRSLDPTLPLDDAAPLTARLSAALAPPRAWASMVGVFAGIALLLAAVGIFGMLSYAVSTRRREIGIRLALGARPTGVVGMVVRNGMACAGIGAVLGLVITVVTVGHLARNPRTLFEVHPTDPPTLIGVAGVLLVVAFAASLLPALSAARTDPLTAIRVE